ncbi:MAG: histone deacetylase [Polyangiaceae bacterium]|nr:histone deacetylase [Polyangiaceae bacterium]
MSSLRDAQGAVVAAAKLLAKRARRFKLRYGLPGARLVFDTRYRLPSVHPVDGQRAERIMRHLGMERVLDAATVTRPPRLAMRDVLRTHDAEYLASLDDPKILDRLYFTQRLGVEAARVLDAQRWACAGTVQAAVMAMKHPWLKSPVVNLGGGFHHARRDKGSGFCALNDVAIAIDRLRSEGFRGSILIVDLDYHHGDGTRSIFADDPTVYTYSIHAQSWDDSIAVATLDVELGPAVGDETYLKSLDDTLPEAFARADPKLVFYVAGADPAATDVLGNWRVTAEGMAERDRRVLSRCKGIPTVMVLAGGYGKEAWRYPARTLVWLLAQDDAPIPTADERALAGFRQIRASISDLALRKNPEEPVDEELRITEADIYGDLFARAPDRRLLGFYSSFGLEVAFERYGLANHLRSKGYEGFVVDADSKVGSVGQGIRVYADGTRSEVLIELVLSELHAEPDATLLSIEWLLLQDPRGAPRDIPLLPGQKHPGLGALRTIVGMLIMTCERLGYDGLTVVPAHFHVATVARRLFGFMSPADEAYFLALAEVTKHLPVQEASMRIEQGGVVHRESGQVAAYRPGRMVLPVSEPLKARLSDASYARRVEDEAKKLDLVLPPLRDRQDQPQ